MYTEKENDRPVIFLEGRIDSNNAAEFEKSLMEAAAGEEAAAPVLDATGLEYISSAGLRVLMKLRKQRQAPLIIRNVSRELYEIFETTGFTQLFDVQKKLREISVEGCEQIGAGLSSRVYRIDRDTIVKVFEPGVTLERIEQERESAKTAFVSGIPTAITFDVVKCGDSYGTVYELIDAVQLSKFLRDNPDRAQEYRLRYARLLKDMHRIELSDSFPDIKDIFRKWVYDLRPLITDEEVNTIKSLIDAIPDRDTFVHCDAHVGNAMVQDGEIIFIDMADVGRGHPVFDIGTLYYHYQIIPGSKGRDFGMKTILGFLPDNNDFVNALWNDLVTGYFEPESEKDREGINRLSRIVSGLRSLATIAKQSQMPEQLRKMAIMGLKKEYFPMIGEYTEYLKGMVDVYFPAST